MSGLYHDFYLVAVSEAEYSDYSRFINDPKAIQLHDDIVRYVADTLSWIPTINPASPKSSDSLGLNFYGPTVIAHNAAQTARVVFHGWADLFAFGPPQLRLTGGYEWIGDDPVTGEYASISADRDEIVNVFRTLARYAATVIKGEHFILHLGI